MQVRVWQVRCELIQRVNCESSTALTYVIGFCFVLLVHFSTFPLASLLPPSLSQLGRASADEWDSSSGAEGLRRRVREKTFSRARLSVYLVLFVWMSLSDWLWDFNSTEEIPLNKLENAVGNPTELKRQWVHKRLKTFMQRVGHCLLIILLSRKLFKRLQYAIHKKTTTYYFKNIKNLKVDVLQRKVLFCSYNIFWKNHPGEVLSRISFFFLHL